MGLSYSAHTQMALGCLDPPGLAAQFLDCGGFSNAYRSGIWHGGAFDLKQATWAWRNALADARDPETRATLAAQDIAAWFARLPGRGWRRGDSPVSAAPEYVTCSSNGHAAPLTNSGNSRASMPRLL
jgi:predicted acyl esterase